MTDEPTSPVAVPKWHEFMRPLLQVLADGEMRTRRQLVAETIESTGMTPEQLSVTLAAGDSQVENRIGFALSAVTNAGAIQRPSRGHYVITDVGHQALQTYPEGIAPRHLKSFPAWVEHVQTSHAGRRFRHSADDDTAISAGAADTNVAAAPGESDSTPEDRISSGVQEIDDTVTDELLIRLQDGSPDFFEDAVVKLLLAMGYGGAEQKGMRVGGTGDGGIDGFADQDPLGLERVYVQAKRYKTGSGIGRETVQAFIGALHGRGASKGVFITTSHFSSGAREYAENVPTRVILIDGDRLTSLMLKYRVGVQVRKRYDVVEIDEDFFE